MPRILYSIIALITFWLSLSFSYAGSQLTVINGYGNGNYEKGDTIHIWSKQEDGKVFTHWTGDVQYLESAIEYHTTVIMPAASVSITANYATLAPSMKLTELNVMGAQRMKKIFAYLPPKEKTKGIVWFFHGTNGNALNMATLTDTKQFIDLIMTRDYGAVVITSEESEYDLDFNNDGFYRWSNGFDSTLVDIANVRAIRDSIYNRGLANRNVKHYAYGYSAGSVFAEFISNVLSWETAFGHAASGSIAVSNNGIVPYFLSVGENDSHPSMGNDGLVLARSNISNYQNRGVCAIYHEQNAIPLYPERFDRSSYISELLSKAIFNELKSNNMLTAKNYLRISADSIERFVIANPGQFPVIFSLSATQAGEVKTELEVTEANHKVKADINGRLFKFLLEACRISSLTDTERPTITYLSIYPNPSSGIVKIRYELPSANQVAIDIFDLQGRNIRSWPLVRKMAGSHTIQLEAVENGTKPLTSGTYICRITTTKGSVSKIIIIK